MSRESDLIEIWKTIVGVQQHFNDIELRIRNFALTLTGAFLALGGYTIKEDMFFSFFGSKTPVSTAIILLSIVPLFAFYFMDKYWYHRLLEGSVSAGIKAEGELQKHGYSVALGRDISEKSPIDNFLYGATIENKCFFLVPKRRMHSRHKMDVFYGILLLSLLTISALLAWGIHPTQSQAPTNVPAPRWAPAGAHSSTKGMSAPDILVRPLRYPAAPPCTFPKDATQPI